MNPAIVNKRFEFGGQVIAVLFEGEMWGRNFCGKNVILEGERR